MPSRARRIRRRVLVALAVALVAVFVGGRGYTSTLRLPLNSPSLAPYATLVARPATPAPGGVRARFLGTSTILFDDGETAIMSDGFVSRPRLSRVLLGRIGPDTARIVAALRRLGVDRIAAVFAGHAHYDHAIDAPVVAARTGAVLLGSSSTANVGRGLGLPEERIHVVHDGETVRYGRFALTFVESRHSRGDRFPGTIDAPLVPPAKASAWRTGTTWSVLVEHDGRTLLVQGSANFRPGALRGRHADVVYLGIGGLGRESDAFIDTYWTEVVRATGARRVVLVHWDDFLRPLDRPLRPMPYAMDNFTHGIDGVRRLAKADGVEVVLPTLWEPADPFAGLPLQGR